MLRALLPGLLVLWGVAAASATPLEPLLVDAARGDRRSVRRAHPASVLPGGRLRVLVRLAPGASPEVALAGFDREAAAGPVVPLSVAPDRLDELAQRPGVLLVEACRDLAPLLDRSAPLSGATRVRAETGLDGHGVVVGIIDTGIDFRHADFLDHRGRTRLLDILDFSLAGAQNGRLPGDVDTHGARLYTAEEIQRQLDLERAGRRDQIVLHRDTYGHGTHVAGIAAGNGAAAGLGMPHGRYVGMAPGAALIAVKAVRGGGANFHDADVIHGIQFVFERAAALGMPAVANISLGTQLGPHDGTSNLATAISALTGPDKPGRVIVAAAGNAGHLDLHAVGYPALDGPSEVVLEIPPYEPTPEREIVHLEIWYDAGALSLELTSPGGRGFGPIPTGGRIEELTPEGLVKLENAPGGPYAGNGRNKGLLIVDERDQIHPRSGRWTLRLAGQVPRYDVWLVNPGIDGDGRPPRLLGPISPDIKLANPGTASGVISVGAYSTRASWLSQDGKITVATVLPDEHAAFSATGPTLDGRFLPDLSAPGEFIVSAMSRDAYPLGSGSAFYAATLPRALWHEDQARGLLRGTSQAAPHVAGAVALLLQRDPSLTLSGARELLRVGARVDDAVGPGQAWSPRWGFGKLDVATSLAVLDGRTPGKVDPLESGVSVNRDLVPPGSTDKTVVTVVPRDGSGLPLGPGRAVTLSTSAGRLSTAVHVARGRYEARFYPEGRRGEVALITATVDGVPLAHRPRVHLTTRRARVGLPYEAAGGCAVGRSSGPVPSPVPGLLLLLLLLGRERR